LLLLVVKAPTKAMIGHHQKTSEWPITRRTRFTSLSLSLSLSLGFDENNTAKEEEQFLGSEGKFSSPNKKEVFLF